MHSKTRKSTEQQNFGTDPSPELIVLVNENDQEIGVEEKTRVHMRGLLHRAFSVFVLNGTAQLLLQRRALTKYHSKGLWSNTCCGHPRPGETIQQASRRRLKEEMGFASELDELFHFIYKAHLENDLIEHEYDHVLLGSFEGMPNPDPSEVVEWKWLDLAKVKRDLEAHPNSYTYWFRISFDQFFRTVATRAGLPSWR